MLKDLVDTSVTELSDASTAAPSESDATGCPLCRRPVPRPGHCRDGSRPLAECLPCDLLFDADDAGTSVRIPALA